MLRGGIRLETGLIDLETSSRRRLMPTRFIRYRVSEQEGVAEIGSTKRQ
jgi:hypothetical protein